jgi:1-acyl-sn-glycerol-3-phosphate acyltransferase
MVSYRPRLADWATRAFGPVLSGVATALFDLELTGAEHVPEGGLIVAPNHLSHIDPPLVTALVGREVRYIALDELFGRVWFDTLTMFFGAIPTNREGRPPLGALKEAINHVCSGGVVGVFPEGRRVAYWGESSPKRGAAWLSWMTGAPLLPVTVLGSHLTMSPASKEAVHRPSLRVWIDRPLRWHDFAGFADPLGAMTDEWRGRIGDHLDVWWAG